MIQTYKLSVTGSNSQSGSTCAGVGRIWIGSCRWPFKPLKGKHTHPILDTLDQV